MSELYAWQFAGDGQVVGVGSADAEDACCLLDAVCLAFVVLHFILLVGVGPPVPAEVGQGARPTPILMEAAD